MKILQENRMIPSLSRPGNPYDNASCESFLRTLKREEIHANDYQDLGHLYANVEAFIEQYYNRRRLHSALGYRTPEDFEKGFERLNALPNFSGATMSFLQASGELRISFEKGSASGLQTRRVVLPGEVSADFCSADCSPFEPASTSQTKTYTEA